MNCYRLPLVLIRFDSHNLPGPLVRRWVGTEMIADLPDGRIHVRFNLVRLSAN